MQATPPADASAAAFAPESDGQSSAQAFNPVQALLMQTMALALDCPLVMAGDKVMVVTNVR